MIQEYLLIYKRYYSQKKDKYQLEVIMSYQISQSVSSLITFPSASIINPVNANENYGFGFRLYTDGQAGFSDFPDTIVVNDNNIITSSLYLLSFTTLVS